MNVAAILAAIEGAIGLVPDLEKFVLDLDALLNKHAPTAPSVSQTIATQGTSQQA